MKNAFKINKHGCEELNATYVPEERLNAQRKTQTSLILLTDC
jgi:hypothetical protein